MKMTKTEHKGFYHTTETSPEVTEKQKEMLDMLPRKPFLVKKREYVKLMIETATSNDFIDGIIQINYGFQTTAEKIAFLKGMFDVEVVSVDDAEGVSKEESDRMTYYCLLEAIRRCF